jgi:hypothetical protein
MKNMTKKQKQKKSKIAEKLKGKKSITNPYALATAMAKGSMKKRKKKK